MLAQYLTVYYASIARSSLSSISEERLTVTEIDNIVGRLNENVNVNATTSFIMSIRPNQNGHTVVGASFQSEFRNSRIVDLNINDSLQTKFSAAAIVDAGLLANISYLNLFLIDKPNDYRLLNDSMNRTLSSSVIIAKLRKVNYTIDPINIQLYFTNKFNDMENTTKGDYFCAYYDTNTSSWDDTGCTKPIFDSAFDRYSCNCSHLSSFDVTWSPSSAATIEPSTTVTNQSTISTTGSTLAATTAVTTIAPCLDNSICYNASLCNDSSQIPWVNGNCIAINDAQV
jgi:hypothetical protein